MFSINPENPRDRLIVALDLPDADSALALADRIGDRCGWYKVGLELYLAAGPTILTRLRERGSPVFLDLKLHDIPNTVASAVRVLAGSGAALLTLHASGGPAMLAAAVHATAEFPAPPALLAVTVLTSMDAAGLRELGVAASPAEQVLGLGRMAAAAGVRGLVCSSREVALLRQTLGTEPLLVVPGIRSAHDTADDQSRTASASEAIAAGASMLVVGRPVTRAADPAEAVARLLDEIGRAL